jgi:hypothetical protein
VKIGAAIVPWLLYAHNERILRVAHKANCIARVSWILRELIDWAEHFNYTKLWRFVMRMFFITVGILSWLLALAVAWIFAENGGVLTVIAAGIFAGLAIISLGVERILKVLEEIRDRAILPAATAGRGAVDRVEVREREIATTPTGAVPA